MKKIITLCIILFSCVLAFAQNQERITVSLDHVALSVKDVDKASQFYLDFFGLEEITNRSEFPGVRWFSLGGGKELHLIALLKDEEVIINKAVHLALTTPDFDYMIQKLKRMNMAYSDWPGAGGTFNVRADGIKQVFFQDSEGYWIEVNSVLEEN